MEHFLRPESPEQSSIVCWKSTSTETPGFDIGNLLSVDETKELLDSSYQPIFVLNKLRALAWDFGGGAGSGAGEKGDSLKQAMLYKQWNEHIDTLTAAWGAMERINGTPLPFVYVVHLRTFLILYLILWRLEVVALNGWISIPPLIVASWGLLGIEAAAVECERPFHWSRNHLPLGKMCTVVSMNVHQTLQEHRWSHKPSSPPNSLETKV